MTRRSLLIHAAATTTTAATIMSSSSSVVVANAAGDIDIKRTFVQRFPSLFDPLYGRATDRKTILRQLSTNLWVLEQNLQLGPLQTPLRCTVIRLTNSTSSEDNGKLWVHAPLAPTPEFFNLIAQHIGSEVAHVIVPTYALEHKIFVKDFLLQWPEAQLWLAPGADFAYPWRTIGNEFLWGRTNTTSVGLLGESDRIDNNNNSNKLVPPWSSEIQYETLAIGTFSFAGGPVTFFETAFYHLPTRSLIVTDAVAKISESYASSQTLTSLLDPQNLLLIAKQSTAEPNLPEDTPYQRQVGYEKTALLISYFFPEHEELIDPTKVVWTDGWHDNFQRLSGRLLVPPVVRTLLYETNLVGVNEFANRITTRWKGMVQIIPAHWEAPIPATATDLQQAFRFCDDPSLDAFPSADLARGLRPLAKLFSSSTSTTTTTKATQYFFCPD